MIDPYAVSWLPSRVVEAVDALAHHVGLPVLKSMDATPTWGASELTGKAFDEWVESSAGWLGLEAEPVEVGHSEVESLLLRAAPALVRIPPDGPLLAIVGQRRRRVTLLGPDLEVHHVPVEELRSILCRPLEAPLWESTEALLGGLIKSPERLRRARDAIITQALLNREVTRCYLLRLPPGGSFLAQARHEGVLRRGAMLLAAHSVQFSLTLLAWYTLGSGAFGGGIDRHWLVAWALLLVTSIPIQLFATWLQGGILRDLATLLKRRLLQGTLRIDQDALRREGAGQLLGRALDASTLEILALGGGLLSVLAVIEFAVVAVLLTLRPGGIWQGAAFVAWGLLTFAMGWRTYVETRRWTRARRNMTSDMIEQMVGHRTRLAQQVPARWHDGEDETLERYFSISSSMDAKDSILRGMPAAWLLVGLVAMVPGIVGGGSSPAWLAVAVGATLLGGATLGKIAWGCSLISAAACSWQEVKPLYEAAEKPDHQPTPDVVASHLVGTRRSADGPLAAVEMPLLDASDIVFSYPGRPQPVLRGGTLRVGRSDRILLEGPSGGGKSTFAAILAGLRQPQSGLLLLEGLDWQTIGPDGWRRRIAAAPQYHDNHIFCETLLFNILMGRSWPPTPPDIRDADSVCRALGLGPLLDRMPAGIMQVVGDTGWRLSHGERSRVFIARALLQNAKIVVLDESFAALDPKTVEQCMRCVFQRAPALIVIAHP